MSSMPIAAIQLRSDRARSWSRCSRVSSRTSASDQWPSPLWHVFPAPAGITGLCLLTESHITIHTFPETGLATINLYCCRPRPAWAWEIHLADILGAGQVDVRTVARGGEPRRRATSSRTRHHDVRLNPQRVSRRRQRSDSHDVAARKSGGRARQTAQTSAAVTTVRDRARV